MFAGAGKNYKDIWRGQGRGYTLIIIPIKTTSATLLWITTLFNRKTKNVRARSINLFVPSVLFQEAEEIFFFYRNNNKNKNLLSVYKEIYWGRGGVQFEYMNITQWTWNRSKFTPNIFRYFGRKWNETFGNIFAYIWVRIIIYCLLWYGFMYSWKNSVEK